jgi:two-component system, chemotaxis family, CheB/CheR fusion protein
MFQLIVVGSSAGGIEALSTLVATLPASFGAPLVIAQHLDPTRPSHLGAILARRSQLPVVTVQQAEPLRPGTIYVVPSNRHVEISDHTITLLPDGIERPMPSVDLLLSSAALAFGEQLIAVILTGTGSDGSSGAQAVKGAGGIVMIQNPATAAYPGMPQSLDPQTVDIVADIERIGPLLLELLNGSPVPVRLEAEQALHGVLETVQLQSGVDFRGYKPATIMRRLQRRIVATETQDLGGYLSFLHAHPEKCTQLVSSFLIKVTEFMRDPELFAVLREQVLPELLAANRTRGGGLRIWSAGCATGEEAYSLAILVAELLGPELTQTEVKIFATDLDTEAIAVARRGIYPAESLARLGEGLVRRYFTLHSAGYEVTKQLRALVVFGEHDLGQRAPFPHIDLVLCRNVLIYFSTELQQRALQLFAFALRDGGYLVLGRTETITPLAMYFTPSHAQQKIYRRDGALRVPAPRLSRTAAPAPAHRALAQPVSAQRELNVARQALEQSRSARDSLLLTLPVGVVVVDARYDILEINSAARRLLAIHTPALGDDLIHLVQHLPQQALRAAIDQAIHQGLSTTLSAVPVPDLASGETITLQLSCSPQEGTGEPPKPCNALLLVTNISGQVAGQQALAQALAQHRTQEELLAHSVAELQASNSLLAERNAELELDAQAQAQVQENLNRVAQSQAEQLARVVSANQELVAANIRMAEINAELRAQHDAYLYTSEEAQAALEEVETLNEEAQASNEELETLNEELQATIEELHTANTDLSARGEELEQLSRTLQAQHQRSEQERARLSAILAGMADAVLVVAPDGTPLLSNAAYQQHFDSSEGVLELEDDQGGALPAGTLPWDRAARGEAFTQTFTRRQADATRRWYEAVGQPIHHDATLLWGVVVIRDITEHNLRRLQAQFLALANHELRAPMVPIKGYLQLLANLLARQGDSGKAAHYAQMALSEVERLQRLANDLLDVSRLQNDQFSLNLAPVELAGLLAAIVESEQLRTTQLQLNLSIADEPLVVRGDSGRLGQVVRNLLGNAITHAMGSTRVAVRLRRVDGMAELSVEDDGAGIPAEHLPDLFGRFYQVTHDRQNTGLGLGLYIAQQIVVAHNGTIAVSSTVGVGTIFTVRLPLLVPDKAEVD